MREKKSKTKGQSAESEKPLENLKNFDAIIVGGGAAGISAAMWCDELGLTALLLESKAELGGQLLRVYNPVKNHLGVETANGRKMRDIFVKQIKSRKFSLRLQAQVEAIDFEAKKVFVESGGSFSAKSLVIATGVRRRRLNIEGEMKFQNRGILRSGKREQDAVAGKKVLIVGGGDAALENALILSEKAERIFLVHRRSGFRARREFLDAVLRNPKVKVLTETVVEEILGEEKIESVKLKNLAIRDVFIFPVEAVLVRIGVEPNSELFRKDLKLDENGYIQINSFCQTSVENVFAVGDVANPVAPTVSGAVGMGATAAKAIFEKLSREM